MFRILPLGLFYCLFLVQNIGRMVNLVCIWKAEGKHEKFLFAEIPASAMLSIGGLQVWILFEVLLRLRLSI